MTCQPVGDDPSVDLGTGARAAGEDVAAALGIALTVGQDMPFPGHGKTAARWSVLAGLAEGSLTVARAVEPHVDALAILAEAGLLEPRDRARSWGVFAAEGPGVRLRAETRDGTTTLNGTKPWCSLAGRLDAALVTAWVGEQRQLFQVDLHADGVRVHPADAWVARGLRSVTSVPVSFTDVPASAVGEPGWYLTRPGFTWGGMGVAACWYGGARGLYRAMLLRAASRADDLLDMQVGTVDAALHAASATLNDAAARIDAHAADGRDGQILAERVRAVVAWAAEYALRMAGHALGPTPLAFDAAHAARAADLEIYLRQHHGERDLATLGRLVARGPDPSTATPPSKETAGTVPLPAPLAKLNGAG